MINFKKLFVGEKKFYKSVFGLVLPLVAAQVMSLVLNFCDIAMLGRLGEGISEAAIAAAQIANRPFFLFSMIMFGSMSGASVMCSQYWGKKDTETINSIAGTTLFFLFPICMVFMAACLIFPKQLMGAITNDEKVIEMAVSYLKIIAMAFVFNLLTGLFSGILRSVESVKIPVIAVILGIGANIFLNAALIYGRFGFPALGIRGAAIATVIARALEFCIVMAYVIFFEKTLRFTPKKMFRIHMVIVKDFFKYSLPVIVNEFVWGFGTIIHSAIIGHMSKEQYAAYTISNMIEQIAFMSMIGFSNACCVMVGKAIGEGRDEETVAAYARTFIGLAVFFVIVTGGAAFAFSGAIIDFFQIDAETKLHASRLFGVVTIFIMLKTFNCVNIVGIFRGGGDTKAGMIIDATFMYCFGIPLGFCAMYFLKLDVAFVYAFLISDEFFKLPAVIWRTKSKKWIRNITREM
ncbi:MAG: MATE family efflux transporter [Oscillospiraceae bacterium]|nr:MATE family efflux transporter [Oscillospiraceae bacterium]